MLPYFERFYMSWFAYFVNHMCISTFIIPLRIYPIISYLYLTWISWKLPQFSITPLFVYRSGLITPRGCSLSVAPRTLIEHGKFLYYFTFSGLIGMTQMNVMLEYDNTVIYFSERGTTQHRDTTIEHQLRISGCCLHVFKCCVWLVLQCNWHGSMNETVVWALIHTILIH